MVTFAGALHAAGGVDGVPEEAVARHLGADDAGHDGARVHPGADLQALVRPVRHAAHHGPRQQVQRHRRDLGHVLFPWHTKVCRI